MVSRSYSGNLQLCDRKVFQQFSVMLESSQNALDTSVSFPLHDWNASGPSCISSFKQGEIHSPTLARYTTGKNLQSYNQKLGA